MSILEEIVERGEFLRIIWTAQRQVLEFYFGGDTWQAWYCHIASEWMTEFTPF